MTLGAVGTGVDEAVWTNYRAVTRLWGTGTLLVGHFRRFRFVCDRSARNPRDQRSSSRDSRRRDLFLLSHGPTFVLRSGSALAALQAGSSMR